MIASFMEGRVRVRAAALKDPATMDKVLPLLKAQDGVTAITPNTRTGSILILYDPEKIPQETLFAAAAALQEQLGASAAGCVSARKKLSALTPLSESLLMAGTYLLTGASGFVGKRAHICFALAFAFLAGVHMYDRRRHLKIS